MKGQRWGEAWNECGQSLSEGQNEAQEYAQVNGGNQECISGQRLGIVCELRMRWKEEKSGEWSEGKRWRRYSE